MIKKIKNFIAVVNLQLSCKMITSTAASRKISLVIAAYSVFYFKGIYQNGNYVLGCFAKQEKRSLGFHTRTNGISTRAFSKQMQPESFLPFPSLRSPLIPSLFILVSSVICDHWWRPLLTAGRWRYHFPHCLSPFPSLFLPQLLLHTAFTYNCVKSAEGAGNPIGKLLVLKWKPKFCLSCFWKLLKNLALFFIFPSFQICHHACLKTAC